MNVNSQFKTTEFSFKRTSIAPQADNANSAFGLDSVDFNSSVMSSDKDFPPGCLMGGSTDVQSHDGGSTVPCMSSSTDVRSGADIPCSNAVSDVKSSDKDFPPGCLMGGASDVNSGLEMGYGCQNSSSDVKSSDKDFPPGCLMGGASDVNSGLEMGYGCQNSSSDVNSSDKDFPPGCLMGGASDVNSGWTIAF